jgi:hypothetical protein
MAAAKVLAIAYVSFADAARIAQQKGGVESGYAFVDATYTFGAPASARAPLSNPRTPDGCFPGVRVWTSSTWLFLTNRDIVPGIFNNNGFFHAKMLAVDLRVTEGDESRTDFPCSAENALEPTYGGLSVLLHDRKQYMHGVSVVEPELLNEVTIAVEVALDKDESQVAEIVRNLGFGLVGSGFHDGAGGGLGGPQASHLIQNPETLDCLVTFQGSSSFGDWLADADITPVSFCGLSTQVHRGFRNHLRDIVKTDSWQQKVRANLPKCNKVYIVGHSLAGAMSELFSACVNQQPSSGAGYDEDFKFMSWTKGSAQKMPYL